MSPKFTKEVVEVLNVWFKSHEAITKQEYEMMKMICQKVLK